MKLLNIISYLLFTSVTMSTAAQASPSETNYFHIMFKGEDAEKFKNTEPKQNDYTYGDNEVHLSKNTYFFFTKDKDKETEFTLEISCQQRVLNYKTTNPEYLSPSCYFTYQGGVAYTTIIMTEEISAKMIKEQKWKEFKNSHSTYYFYGCYDNKQSGCPTIRYKAKSDKTVAEVDIRFFKPSTYY